MRAVIYARYSTDEQDKNTIIDQVRECTELAEKHGFEVGEVYKDEGISGAAIGNRPGVLALMADAERRRFDVLLVLDLTRLSRNQGDLPKLAERLIYFGVRILSVQEGADSHRRDEFEIAMAFYGVMGQQFRRLVAKKVHISHKAKAKAGRNCGGEPYGYVTKYEEHPTEKDDGKPVITARWLEVDPEESKIVVEIFESYANGMSPEAIAAALNRRGVPSPGSRWTGRKVRRSSKWMASTISSDPERGLGILNNSIVIGKRWWNRSQWIKEPDTGKRKCFERPQSEWIEIPYDEKLRIIPQEIWDRVRARQASRKVSRGAAVAKGIAAAKKKRVGGRDSRYFLGSILKCGICGANLIGDGRTDYVCPSYSSGGCTNDLRTRREPVHQAVFDALKGHLLSPSALVTGEKYIEAVLRERERQEAEALRAAADGKPVKRIDAQIAALEALDLPDDVKALAVAKLEAQRAEIIAGGCKDRGRAVTAAQLAARMPQIAAAYCTAVENGIKCLADIKAVAAARESVRKLLVDGFIVVSPDAEHTALTGTVRFKELGEHVLETAGIRRKIGHLEQAPDNETTLQVSLVAGVGFEPTTFGL